MKIENYNIKKLRSLPLHVIIKKIVRKLYKKIYYDNLRKRIINKPVSLEDNFFADFNPECRFLYKVDNAQYYKSILGTLHAADKIVISAEKICNHEFNLLGSGKKYLGKYIEWNRDFKSDFIWKNEFYKDIKIVDLSNDADVKVPWELSRFQHFFTIGKAYWLTGDEKYPTEFKDEIEDWIINNPVCMSVNWTCTMDTAIRAVNWICGYFFFQKSGSLDSEFRIRFNKSLYLHGRYIYNNLENEGQHNTNHYISDLCGLIFLGIYFRNFSVEDDEKANNPEAWLTYGLSELENEMKKEVNEDGTDYEASTSYHRLVTEINIITAMLCSYNDIYFSEEYMKKLSRMCEFLMNITKPGGLSPVIGDADDGRLIILSDYDNWNRRDFRHILAAAGEYFDRDDFRAAGKDFSEDALWLVGKFKNTGRQSALTSAAYPQGGYYVLRNNRIYCMVRCGELSCRGEGAHSHNDQLSFELNVDGENFIIDPGSYLYTADYKMRNLFRSTEMHNTLCIAGCEQNDFNEYDLFYMKEQTFAECCLFNDNEFSGEHYGYKNAYGVTHKRNICLHDNYLSIGDKLYGSKISIKAYINFNLDAGVTIERKEKGILLSKNNKKILLEFCSPYSIEDSFISYGYGQKIRTKRISVEMKGMDSNINIICV